MNSKRLITQEKLVEVGIIPLDESAPKLILDACASHRRMWFSKNQANTVYLDIRDDEKLNEDHLAFEKQRGRIGKPWTPKNPTLKGDFRKLNFPDKTFKLIVFDPPHLQYLGETSIYKKKFGKLCAETWPDDIKQGSRELWRILDDNGVLIFKWNNHDIPFKDVLALFPAKPLFGQITAGKHNHGAYTCWFTFMKITKERLD